MNSSLCSSVPSLVKERFKPQRTQRKPNTDAQRLFLILGLLLFVTLSIQSDAILLSTDATAHFYVPGSILRIELDTNDPNRTKILCFPAGSWEAIASKAKPRWWKLAWAKAASFSLASARNTAANRWQVYPLFFNAISGR